MLQDLEFLLDDDLEQSIPLPTADEEKEMSLSDVPDVLPILTLRNTVLFPGVVLPITGSDMPKDMPISWSWVSFTTR